MRPDGSRLCLGMNVRAILDDAAEVELFPSGRGPVEVSWIVPATGAGVTVVLSHRQAKELRRHLNNLSSLSLGPQTIGPRSA